MTRREWIAVCLAFALLQGVVLGAFWSTMYMTLILAIVAVPLYTLVLLWAPAADWFDEHILQTVGVLLAITFAVSTAWFAAIVYREKYNEYVEPDPRPKRGTRQRLYSNDR